MLEDDPAGGQMMTFSASDADKGDIWRRFVKTL
jgi:hypothetical protein